MSTENMEPLEDRTEVRTSWSGNNWYASEGVGEEGQRVVTNYVANSQQETDALAHGLGIANKVHFHKRAEYIGPASALKLFDKD